MNNALLTQEQTRDFTAWLGVAREEQFVKFLLNFSIIKFCCGSCFQLQTHTHTETHTHGVYTRANTQHTAIEQYACIYVITRIGKIPSIFSFFSSRLESLFGLGKSVEFFFSCIDTMRWADIYTVHRLNESSKKCQKILRQHR